MHPSLKSSKAEETATQTQSCSQSARLDPQQVNQPNRPSQLSGLVRPLFGKTPQQVQLLQSQAPQQQKRKSSASWLRKFSGHTPTSPPTSKTKTFDIAQTKETVAKDGEQSEPDAAPDVQSEVAKLEDLTTTPLATSEIPTTECSVLPIKEIFESTTSAHVDQAFDLEDLHRTQKSLLELKSNFDAGKLKVFESEEALNRMIKVRTQQERLSRLHFELHATQSANDMYTQSARTASLAHLKQLMIGLQSLKQSVEEISSVKMSCDPNDETQ